MAGGFLTTKAIANTIKAKGLQKLRWYCQMCEKQCRDENGFKCHLMSESHMRQMELFAENPDKYVDQYSTQFLNDFSEVLSKRYNGRRVSANMVYQEFISDRNHLHMNATKWASLSDFVKWMGREGLCEVEETEKGWFVKWIDRSLEALRRTEAEQKRSRLEKTEEELEMKILQEQMKKAKEMSLGTSKNNESLSAVDKQDDQEKVISTELKRKDDDEKIQLTIKPLSSGGPSMATGGGLLKKGGLKKTNPFAKVNALSQAKPPPSSSSISITSTNTNSVSKPSLNLPKKTSSLDQIIQEEMTRKRAREIQKSSSSLDSKKFKKQS